MSSRRERAAEKFRRGLIKRDKATARRLLRQYKIALRSIQSDYGEFMQRYEAEYNRLDPDLPEDARRIRALDAQRARLESLRQNAERQISRFAGAAYGTVESERIRARGEGARQARELVNAALPRGIEVAGDIVPVASVEQVAAQTGRDAPLRQLFESFGKQAADKAVDTITQGVALGRNPRVIARQLSVDLGTSLNRALTISRTEVLQAHRAASLEQFRADSDVVSGWTWYAQIATCCAACAAMHGTKHTLDESLDSHPNCRCAMLPNPVTFEELGITGIDEPVTDVQTGQEYLDSLSPSERRKRTEQWGAGVADGFERGDLSLDDMVHESSHPVWGKGRRQSTLEQARKNAGIRS